MVKLCVTLITDQRMVSVHLPESVAMATRPYGLCQYLDRRQYVWWGRQALGSDAEEILPPPALAHSDSPIPAKILADQNTAVQSP